LPRVFVLVLSDIHGNLEALEACLAAAPAFDRVVNLGDVVGYGANPNEVMDLVRSIGAVSLRGNHDKACAGTMDLSTFNPIATLAAMWTRETLRPENLEELKNLPQGPLYIKGCEGAQFVHGSPLDEDEYLLTTVDGLEQLMVSQVPVTFFGHTHIQGGFAIEGNDGIALRPNFKKRDETETYEQPLRRDGRYLINPGSAGQPRDGDWRAAFAVFDCDNSIVTFCRVPYDVKRAQRKILAANLPERLAHRLKDGR
jgi:diadenosine tetraphosphatase ApaH/serine/threonine PP2A family protein phosphatase